MALDDEAPPLPGTATLLGVTPLLDGGEAADVDLRVDDALAPSVMRNLFGQTPTDAEVDALPLPSRPILIRVSVRVLRSYRALISPRLGTRCVFDPSCSRYAELALRQDGVVRGVSKTIMRLTRCRPGHGGVDLP